MVKRVVESALSNGQVVRPWLGVAAQPVTQDVARSLGLDRPRGVLVTELWSGGPAERAGVQRGDVILQVNGADVFDEQAVRYQAATQRPGATLPIRIVRGQDQRTVNARVEAPPRTPAPDPRDITGENPMAGTKIVTLSPAAAEEAGLSPFVSGVFIQAMDSRGVAARAGFRPGDIIRSVNGARVRTSAELQRALAGQTRWAIEVQRGAEVGTLNFGR